MGDVAAVGVVVLCQGTSTLEYLATHHFGRFVKVPPPWSALIVTCLVLCQGTTTLEYLAAHRFGRFVKAPPPWSTLIITRSVLCQGTTTLECLNAPTSSVTPDLPVLRRHRHFDFDPETVLPRPCSRISPSIISLNDLVSSSIVFSSMLYLDLNRVGLFIGYLD